MSQYPGLFTGQLKTFFQTYRFALPNIVSAFMFLITLVIGIFLLRETKQSPVSGSDSLHERSPLVTRNRRFSSLSVTTTQAYEPAIVIMPSTSEDEAANPIADEVAANSGICANKQASLWEESAQFNFHIYLYLAMFAVLCFHQMSSDQMFPLFCSTSPENGGLSLTYDYNFMQWHQAD